MRKIVNAALICIALVLALLLFPRYFKEEDAIKNNTEQSVRSITPQYGGTLRLSTLPVDTYNPLLTKDIYTNDILSIIYEGIINIDENYKPVPELAEKWETSDDGRAWTFYIRKNVMWHDNMPFTGEDVEFTLRTLSNPLTDSIYKKNIEKISSFEVVDKYTVRLFTTAPYSFLPECLNFPIIPKHIFADSRGNCRRSTAYPIGTGPYKWIEENGKNIVLAANNKWWAETPYINSVIIKICKNYNEYINSIQVRESDFLRIGREDFNKFSDRVYLETEKYTSKDFDFIAFNLSKPVFKDKNVRQAIANAIEKQKLIDYLLKGKVEEAGIPLSPKSYLYNQNIKNYDEDGLNVRNLLRKGGWRDEQILWSKVENGTMYTTDFELLVNKDNDLRCKIADEIALRLKEFGIRINVKKVSWEEQQQCISNRNFDMVLTGWRLSNIPDLSFAYSSNQASGETNIANYINERVNELLIQILIDTDSDGRKAKINELQTIINDDVPIIGLYFINDAIVYNKRIMGEISPHCNDVFGNISKWYIWSEQTKAES